MNLLKRIWDIIKAFFSSIFGGGRNPEKQIEKMIREYKDELFNIKQEADATKQDLQKIRMRLSDCDKAIQNKVESAQFALRMGREDDARTSLIDKRIFEVTKDALEQDFIRLEKNVANLQDCLHEMTNVIKELEERRDDAIDKMDEVRRKNLINEINVDLQNHDAKDMLDAEMELVNHVVENGNANNNTTLDDELASVKPKNHGMN